MTRSERRAGVLAVAAQIGTPFDFYFDLQTRDAIYCVELLRYALPDPDLPECEIFGRTSAIPDQVIAQALCGETSLVFRGFVYGRRGEWGIGTSTRLAQTIACAWGRPPSLGN